MADTEAGKARYRVVVDRTGWCYVVGPEAGPWRHAEDAQDEADKLNTLAPSPEITGLRGEVASVSAAKLCNEEEIQDLRERLHEIASQCHNLPRSATADRIEKLATGQASPSPTGRETT